MTGEPETSDIKGPVNSEGCGVAQVSGMPGWQWWAWTPNGMTQGGASTAAEAWRVARAARAAATSDIRPTGMG